MGDTFDRPAELSPILADFTRSERSSLTETGDRVRPEDPSTCCPPRPSSSAPFRFPSDADLAFVNLVLAGLDVVTAERLRAATREVIDRGARSDQGASPCRATMTDLLRRGGPCSDLGAPSGEDALEQASDGVSAGPSACLPTKPRRGRKQLAALPAARRVALRGRHARPPLNGRKTRRTLGDP